MPEEPVSNEWWNRRAPGEGWVLQIDPETGRVSEHWHEHLWLAPFRGAVELCSDIVNRRMRTRDWAFLWFLAIVITRGS